MTGNIFGRHFVLASFGESHGPALGAVIDGCPSGVPLSVSDIAAALNRRRPGQSTVTSQRMETDAPEILSGVFEGHTLGTPIAVIVRNTDARSEDYDRTQYRPGHADRTWEDKYGIRDHRGGGRSSGRETIARVIGGAIAEKLLPGGIRIVGYAVQIGRITSTGIPDHLTREMVDLHETRCPDPDAAARMSEMIHACRETGESLGGIIELWIDGVPAGLGAPVFRKAKSELAAALMSVGAVTGVTLGDAAADILLPGSVYHAATPAPGISTRAHGIQGGITNGERIVLRSTIKPAGTTGVTAQRGRHDPCIIPRVIPVLEAMAAMTLADLWLDRRLDRATTDSHP